MKISFGYGLILVIVYAVLEQVQLILPTIPELAEMWWAPVLTAIIAAILSWIASSQEEIESADAEDSSSRWRRFWYG